ncbi:MAG: hypothetical protein Q7S37_00510 [bacterium]|nr:hypothetical protein [bacterium]
MMGMNSNMMTGGLGGSMMFFGWILYILVVVVLALGAAALWKYINKN